MTAFGIILIILVVLAFLYLYLATPSLRRTPTLDSFGTRPFAHRGLHDKDNGIPENSLAAFRRSVENNYGFEFDVRMTADGKLVVMHDDSLERMTGIKGCVSEKTLDELSAYTLLGTDEHIPLFTDVLKLVAGRVPLIVEIKVQGKNREAICSAVAQQLDTYNGAFVVESFDPLAVRWFKLHRPKYIRGQLLMRFSKHEKTTIPSVMSIIEGLMLINFLGRPDFLGVYKGDVDAFGMKLNRGLFGAREYRWTITSQEEYEQAEKVGSSVIFEGFIPKQF